MTREEAIVVLKTLMKNPLFSEVHKVAFNIAIHDIKQRHDWDINNLILINKDDYESHEPIINKDCVHCSKTYGTVGCCDTVNNEWVYSCKEGQREYLLNNIRAEIAELDNKVCQQFLIEDVDKEVHHAYQDCLNILDKYKADKEQE